jgi:hypothetical protein
MAGLESIQNEISKLDTVIEDKLVNEKKAMKDMYQLKDKGQLSSLLD